MVGLLPPVLFSGDCDTRLVPLLPWSPACDCQIGLSSLLRLDAWKEALRAVLANFANRPSPDSEARVGTDGATTTVAGGKKRCQTEMEQIIASTK